MNTRTVSFSAILSALAFSGVLFFAVAYSSIAEAAQGCGFGFHRNGYGYCVKNYPGPYAKPAPRHPGCWRNFWGQLRCYR